MYQFPNNVAGFNKKMEMITVVCPYCKNVMENGFIQSPRAIFWSSRKKIIFIGAHKSKGDIPITKLNGLTSKEAYYCKTCKNVIVTALDNV